MIRKLGACLMAFTVATAFLPATSNAAASPKAQNQKVKKKYNQLKKLPYRGAAVSKVNNLANYLFKNDTAKTLTYYKTATQKYPLDGAKSPNGSKLKSSAIKAVNKSDLKANKKKQIKKKLNNFWKTIPTPTPYHAFTESMVPSYV